MHHRDPVLLIADTWETSEDPWLLSLDPEQCSR